MTTPETPIELTPHRLAEQLEEAERKAWDSLAKYKFVMFGYWCGVWVHLNRLDDEPRRNPWRDLVKAAREHQGRYTPGLQPGALEALHAITADERQAAIMNRWTGRSDPGMTEEGFQRMVLGDEFFETGVDDD